MKVREVVRLLEDNGWQEVRMRGSHRQVEMNARRYSIVIERTSTGFSAYSPDVPGCAAAGDTEEETAANMQEALAFHLEGMTEVGEAIPEPCSSVRYVDVAA